MLVLRDMLESDIDDYVRWFTKETEFNNWDGPWEENNPDPDYQRIEWTKC